jgi:hypothetical protein
MKKIAVSKGRKWFWPFQMPWPVLFRRWTGRYWLVRFDESARYELPNNYRGWNKGGGIIFSLLKNNEENHLWAWRWHEGLRAIQITAYSNQPGAPDGRIIGYPGAGDVLLLAKPGDLVEIIMKPSPTGMLYIFYNVGNGHKTYITHPTRKRWWLAKLSGFWFGGQYPAPHRITIEAKVRKWKG